MTSVLMDKRGTALLSVAAGDRQGLAFDVVLGGANEMACHAPGPDEAVQAPEGGIRLRHPSGIRVGVIVRRPDYASIGVTS